MTRTVLRTLVTAAAMLCMLCNATAQERNSLTIIFYNTENFFDCEHDTLHNDYEFLPSGKRHWTRGRMDYKAEQTARVLANAGGSGTPALIGLCEVENRKCLDLLCRKMPDYHYNILHSESPDERGIDVALLYDHKQFHLLDSAFLRVGESKGLRTRDILYASGRTAAGDTLHLFVCHLPSMLGGAKASEWKRQTAKDLLRHCTDSLLQVNPEAHIVVMGDMNCQPADDISGLHNRMLELKKKGIGTEKYRGRWTCLDQFYLSHAIDSICGVSVFAPAWLSERDDKYNGTRPKRTFYGYQYRRDGYSDHFPIVLKY